jgi:hypothetical protein
MGPETKLVGERTRKILDDLAERMIPSGSIDYPGARDIGLVDKTLELAQTRIPMGVFMLKALAWLWELSPFFWMRFKLLTKMAPEEQIEYLECWEKSRFMLRRWILLGLKAVFMAVFYNDPLIWEKIGYKTGKCYSAAKEAGK